jgi:hypothetical protein
MIRCYCDPPSVRAGDSVCVAVSTDAPRFVLRIYRQTANFEPVTQVPTYESNGELVGDGVVDGDWGWPVHQIALPEDLQSGAYFVVAGEVSTNGEVTWPPLDNTAGESGKALFVVTARQGHRQPILYKLSWFTFVCYNWTGGGSLYAGANWSDARGRPGYRVSWRRPGVSTGGLVAEGDPVDVYVPTSRRQTFEHWDAPFFRWLHNRTLGFDVATDLDIHRDPGLLDQYNLVLSVGHDEYWSDELRDGIDGYISKGGNMAFLSGNTCCFRVTVDEVTATLSCEKAHGHEYDYIWQARRPEQDTTGVSYWNAGGWWDGHRPQLGFRLYHQGHWAYDGVDTGRDLGAKTSPPLVGYECDGADYQMQRDYPVVTRGAFGRLPVVLGLAKLGDGWYASKRGAAATIATYTDRSGGMVFTGGTTDWPIVAEVDSDVGRVTENVVNALMQPSLRLLGPFHDGRVAEVITGGSTYEFRVQQRPSPGDPGSRFAWRIAIDDKVEMDWTELGTVAQVEVPVGTSVLTVSAVERTSIGASCGFGSITLDVLDDSEGATIDFMSAIRRAATPGGPPGNLTDRELGFPRYRHALSPTQTGILREALDQMVDAHGRLREVED